MLRWLKTVVVSDEEKAPEEASGGDREGERKRIAAEVSKIVQSASELGRARGSRMSLADTRLLARWCPACRRREPGLRLSRGTWEGWRRHRVGPGRAGARGSVPSGRNREGL